MLDVIVTTTVKHPEHQVFTSLVEVNNYNKLTPKSARASLAIAGYHTGEVWALDPTVKHGYRVYPNSTRKIYQE